MASSSYKSAVARIASIRYTELNELKRIRIPKDEQKVVECLVKKPKVEEEDDESETPTKTPSREGTPKLIADQETLLKMFENGNPIKCVRVPKREQRNVHLHIERKTKKKMPESK